jgi:SAM-dependent methyltransferase
MLAVADRLRLGVRTVRAQRRNKEFAVRYPDFVLPPHHLAFDTYGIVEWRWYKKSGEVAARQIVELLARHGMTRPRSLLDWGCGPARVVRHLPGLMPETALHASDYDRKTIEWCTAHVDGVSFAVNGLEPPLPYGDGQFDCIYGISVITHLSRTVAEAWLGELARVLASGGLLAIWTNGDKVAQSLLPDERRAYEEGRHVTRACIGEGRKWFLSVHPQAWVREQLSRSFAVEEHVPGGFGGAGQDIWVARRL